MIEMRDSVVNRDDTGRYLGFMVCYILILGFFCYTKQGSMEGYGKVILPMSFIMLFFFVSAVVIQSANMRYVLMTIVLISLGTVMQVLVGDKTPYRFMTGRMISLVLSAILVFLCLVSQRIPVKLRISLYICAVIILFLLSIRFGITLNDSRAWLGMKDPESEKILWSFQATEALKVISMLILSGIFESKHLSDAKKMTCSFATVLAATLIIGIYMKEFGTVLVLFFVWIIGIYIILGERYFIKAALCISGMSLSIITASFICSRLAGRVADKSLLIVKPLLKMASVWGKFSQRMNLFFHLETMDAYEAPYQLILSRQALRLAGLFGNSNSFHDIPVQSSDMVVSMILLRMGLILGLIIMVIFLMSYREAFRIAYKNNRASERYTVMLFSSYILIQTLLSMFSSQGFFLLIGLPVCLFSSGNTQDMITMGMILYIIYASRNSARMQSEADT